MSSLRLKPSFSEAKATALVTPVVRASFRPVLASASVRGATGAGAGV
nr:hypothetical protein [Tanacetum cinerariifolium]